MISTCDPSTSQNTCIFFTASCAAPSGGVKMHQRFTKRPAKPASGPDCSVPATGWAGTSRTCEGSNGARVEITAVLTEPTSVTIAACLRTGATMRPIASFAPTGTQSITQSASRTAIARSLVISSPRFRAFALSNASSDRSARQMRRAAPRFRTARATEDPIKPTPMIVRTSNSGASSGGPSLSTTFAPDKLS